MKKYLILLPFVALLFMACSSETADTAGDYNDDMVAIQTEVDDAAVALLDAIDTFDPAEMEAARVDALDAVKKAQKEIDEMRDFDKKPDFKNEMKDLIAMYKDIFENEMTELIDMVGYSEEMTDEDWDRYDELYDDMMEKYNKAHDKFDAFQDEFAKEWEFEVDRSE